VIKSIKVQVKKWKRRIDRRLAPKDWADQPDPMFQPRGVSYEMADKARGLKAAGIGLMLLLAQRTGLVRAIDRRVSLLKVHLPYHESDHVLNVAFNILAGGQCLEHLELLRNDEVYLDALGAQRIPDPTTAGDFCRRFQCAEQVDDLQEAINEARLRVWEQQPAEFFEEAIIDADGTLAPTQGKCKEGTDFAYDGTFGYGPLLLSLANTQEPLYLVNRSANRPSHEGAAPRFDQAIELCRRAGFRRILLRGDTDFSQTAHLDGWHAQGVRFVFGIDAMANLVKKAAELPREAWERLERPPKYQIKTTPRDRPLNVRDVVVREREYKNYRLQGEEVAVFDYSPTECEKTYRVVVVRKNIAVEKGEDRLFDEYRHFFYITNIKWKRLDRIVQLANGRCDQENLIGQLKGGTKALGMPVDNLYSNWAYMVMAALAWTLKAWFGLLLPEGRRWKRRYAKEKHAVLRMGFRTFLNAFMLIPCQLVRTGRRLVFRVIAWNAWLPVFFRAADTLQHPLRC